MITLQWLEICSFDMFRVLRSLLKCKWTGEATHLGTFVTYAFYCQRSPSSYKKERWGAGVRIDYFDENNTIKCRNTDPKSKMLPREDSPLWESLPICSHFTQSLHNPYRLLIVHCSRSVRCTQTQWPWMLQPTLVWPCMSTCVCPKRSNRHIAAEEGRHQG